MTARRLALALALLPIACSEGEPSHVYIVCRCRPGFTDCQDSMSPVATIATEKCPKGATVEVLCTGAGCPVSASHPSPPDGGTPP